MDKELKEKLEDELYEQLVAFKEKKEEGYDRYVFRRDRCLVKVFKFVPKDDSTALGEDVLLMPSALDGKMKPTLVSQHEKLYPVVKVIKKGEQADDWIKEGRLYTVPRSDIVGTEFNPEFLHTMQTFAKAGVGGRAAMVNVPEDMPQKLPKIDIQWGRYKFSMPDRVGPETEDDKLVFFIPSLKLEADYLL